MAPFFHYSIQAKSGSKTIIKGVVTDKEGNSLLPNLDLVPTTFNLVDLEEDERGSSEPAYLRFYKQLQTVEDQYDYIIFDNPPNILRASQLGVFSANEIYVPSNPDALSLIGFTLLVEKLLTFHKRSASFRGPTMGPTSIPMGVVFNAIKANVDIEVPKMRMQLRLNQFKTKKRAHAKAKIFDTQIRDATVVRRAVTLGLPVSMVGQQSAEDTVVNDYLNFAKELIRHDPYRGT